MTNATKVTSALRIIKVEINTNSVILLCTALKCQGHYCFQTYLKIYLFTFHMSICCGCIISEAPQFSKVLILGIRNIIL